MPFWFWFFVILGIIALTIFILGFPRKKNERTPSFEGIDDPGVAKAFERMANFFPFKILRRKVVSELKKMNPIGTLVDLGCGTGHLIVQIASKFPILTLFGVDISSEILEKAKNRASVEGFEDRIDFKVGDAEEMPFQDDSIDMIVSTLSLHHWAEPVQILQEIHRILKPAGKFLIFDFRRDARKFFYGLFTFATKIVVPKALKRVKEPLGSIKASYTPEEVLPFFAPLQINEFEIKPYAAWMFIKGVKRVS